MPAYAPPTDDELRLVAVLVTGVTDATACARLGLPERTFRRRLRGVLEKLGAASRFQAGYRLAAAGWLDGGNSGHPPDEGARRAAPKSGDHRPPTPGST